MRVINQNPTGSVRGADAPSTSRTERSGSESDKPSKVSTSTGDASGGITAEISPRAHEMVQAKNIAASAPDVRETKIAELKKRIAEKNYNVKPEDVADRMVDEHMHTRGRG